MEKIEFCTNEYKIVEMVEKAEEKTSSKQGIPGKSLREQLFELLGEEDPQKVNSENKEKLKNSGFEVFRNVRPDNRKRRI